MGDLTSTSAQPDTDASGLVELIVKKEPDSTTVSAKLPERHAVDLLPLAALGAVLVGPPAVFHFANVTATPWWVAAPVGLAQLAGLIIVYCRARPSTR